MNFFGRWYKLNKTSWFFKEKTKLDSQLDIKRKQRMLHQRTIKQLAWIAFTTHLAKCWNKIYESKHHDYYDYQSLSFGEGLLVIYCKLSSTVVSKSTNQSRNKTPVSVFPVSHLEPSYFQWGFSEGQIGFIRLKVYLFYIFLFVFVYFVSRSVPKYLLKLVLQGVAYSSVTKILTLHFDLTTLK